MGGSRFVERAQTPSTNDTPIPVTPPTSSTSTQDSVLAAIASTTLLPANADRRGATVYNDSTAYLYLLLGTGPASTTAFTLRMAPQSYYEVPFNWIGDILGIWSAADGGFARVTELTA